MKKTLTMYLMTFLMVGLAFRCGPDYEAAIYPINTDMSITEVYRTHDAVCFTWKFTKRRDLPLDHMSFNITDVDGIVYDAETIDRETGKPIFFNPVKARYAVNIEHTRHLCTSLPYLKDPLTLRGKLVYKTWVNLWQVTHFTPTTVVPKGN